MQITVDQLVRAVGCSRGTAEVYAPLFNTYLPEYGIDTPAEWCSFLSMMAVETAQFSSLVESFNYTPERLANVFPSKFRNKSYKPNYLALRLGRVRGRKADQQAIANHVYANRYGNGGFDSGDGFKYRGRGIPQLTFKANYEACAEWMQVDIVERPNLLTMPLYAVLAGIWYWVNRGMDRYDDDLCINKETKVLTGSYIGLKNRERMFSRLHDELYLPLNQNRRYA